MFKNVHHKDIRNVLELRFSVLHVSKTYDCDISMLAIHLCMCTHWTSVRVHVYTWTYRVFLFAVLVHLHGLFMHLNNTLWKGRGRDGGDRESRGMGSGREELIEALLLTALTRTSI